MQAFFSRYLDGLPALGLLILRVVIGAAFMIHGWSKIQTPFSWMKGGHIPGFMQALAALGEFGGGLGILLGLLTPIAALGALCTMIGAWVIVHRGDPWIKPGAPKTFELASLYAVVALALIFTGPGRLSLDALLFGRGKR